MGKVVGPPLPSNIKSFIEKQHIFFVGSAALSAWNRVNVSPKSANEFRVIDDNRCVYMDYMGSGGETCAHIMENKRLTFMFVSFVGPPNIVRLYGKGRIVTFDQLFQDEETKSIAALFGIKSTQDVCRVFRSFIIMDIERVSSSCGYSIPKFEYVKDRKTLFETIESIDMDVQDYVKSKNAFSIDGLWGIGVKNANSIPTKKVCENGYYKAEYESNTNYNFIIKSFKQLRIYIGVLIASGITGRKRDILFTLVGFFLAYISNSIIRTKRLRNS